MSRQFTRQLFAIPALLAAFAAQADTLPAARAKTGDARPSVDQRLTLPVAAVDCDVRQAKVSAEHARADIDAKAVPARQ